MLYSSALQHGLLHEYGYRKEGKMRILLVEDDMLIGDGIKTGLAKWVLASTGLPTVERARGAI